MPYELTLACGDAEVAIALTDMKNRELRFRDPWQLDKGHLVCHDDEISEDATIRVADLHDRGWEKPATEILTRICRLFQIPVAQSGPQIARELARIP